MEYRRVTRFHGADREPHFPESVVAGEMTGHDARDPQLRKRDHGHARSLKPRPMTLEIEIEIHETVPLPVIRKVPFVDGMRTRRHAAV